MKRIYNKIVKITGFGSLFTLLMTNVIFAGSIQDTKIVTGTVKLIQDIGTALILLATAGVVVLASYAEIMHRKAEDIGEQTKWKNIRNGAIIGYIIILSMASIVAVIAVYYR